VRGAFAHAQQPERGTRLRRHADPIVLDRQAVLALHRLPVDPHPARLRVAGHVGERLLGNAVELVGLVRAQAPGIRERGFAAHARALGELTAGEAERRLQAEVVEQGRAQRCRDPPHRGDALAEHGLDLRPVLLPPGRPLQRTMHHHLERGEQLPELIMHLARQPPALVLDAAVEAVREGLDLAERLLQLGGASGDGVLEAGVRGNQRHLRVNATPPLALQQAPGGKDQRNAAQGKQEIEDRRTRPQRVDAAIARLDLGAQHDLDGGEAHADPIHRVAALFEAPPPRRVLVGVGTAIGDVALGERDAVVDQGPQGVEAGLRPVGEHRAQRLEGVVQPAHADLDGVEIVLVAGQHVAALAGLDVLHSAPTSPRRRAAGRCASASAHR